MSSLVQIRSPGSATRISADAADPRSADGAPGTISAGARVYLETLGCQMNEADSAIIMGQLRARGYTRVEDPALADVILLNTCAVREKAEDRVYGRTSQLLRHRKDNPDLVFGITGCMAEHLRDKVSQQAPYIGLVAGPDSYRRIGALVDRARTGERVIDVALDKSETYEGLDGVPDDDGVSGQISIQRGCDKFCTFCVVPYTRGRERGVAPREVLRAARSLVERGYKEIVLLGQTVNSYAWEDVSFADLLRALAGVDGLERIRFTSPYPVDFSDELIAMMASEPKICPYMHLPAQSGSDAMLTAMKRGYTREQFLTLVKKLRAAMPDLAISTDLMVGFCGETEADHQETLSLMREVRFDSAFMFRYSDRGITYAARKLQDDVPSDVKGRRLQEVIDLQEQHTRAAHAARVGGRERVLVSGMSKRGDRTLGRTPSFYTVLLPLGLAAPGETVEVEITGTTGHSLLAG
ncbi:MAG TPA: tRNA (N6-isopentenyl adenosine(37)-C2)-methylthiotransferase MiaB [Nannocystis sp.]|jgi:tRNA-2-methylthio-N6-dimethylallyladenosine synthase